MLICFSKASRKFSFEESDTNSNSILALIQHKIISLHEQNGIFKAETEIPASNCENFCLRFIGLHLLFLFLLLLLLLLFLLLLLKSLWKFAWIVRARLSALLIVCLFVCLHSSSSNQINFHQARHSKCAFESAGEILLIRLINDP